MQRGFRLVLPLLTAVAACQSGPTDEKPTSAAPAKGAVPAAAGWAGKVDSLTAAQLPRLEKLPGKLLQARRWTDAAGENLLVLYRTHPAAERTTKYTDEESHVELYARQYVRLPSGEFQEMWRLQDAVRNCPFDMWLGPLPGSTRITDLDHDGTTETTLVYKLTCRSDVSPSDMKLIMHEGKAKYALRGQMVVQYDSVPLLRRVPANSCCTDTLSKEQLDAPEGYELLAGRYQNENDFRAAPPAFLHFARAQWRRWITHDEFEQF
ncbi:M949_RS01915 family surface polysaccharide biosynthesis protein [Solirubrum puertoriconensis]|uniref:Lipoprotein n=1 Tax=Solirubrum puertoriconensis TaxID=1751427 RepID=A0A9X0HHX2_SOLP1|nr:hypothetical protein [Solirubrum puertoriconensis]KUG06226.1 hypothetical protein ASU33_02345 [Solirubrum puertoriconensis]